MRNLLRVYLSAMRAAIWSASSAVLNLGLNLCTFKHNNIRIPHSKGCIRWHFLLCACAFTLTGTPFLLIKNFPKFQWMSDGRRTSQRWARLMTPVGHSVRRLMARIVVQGIRKRHNRKDFPCRASAFCAVRYELWRCIYDSRQCLTGTNLSSGYGSAHFKCLNIGWASLPLTAPRSIMGNTGS